MIFARSLLASLTVATAVGVMVWLAAASDRWQEAFSFTGHQGDYYNLLVDGFQDGQLHLNAEVHPDRLSPDPEARKRAPYLLDAAFYRGRYYLYYGVVPAVMVLLPYSAITGHDLSLNVPTLGFVLLGFLVSAGWYFDVRRRHFPATPAVVDCAAVLLLAFGPATSFLIRRSMFYELPLAAGYTFLCGFIWAATRALEDPGRAVRWIALASLCVGLAAGCHPNYAFLTLLVALLAWWSYRAQPAGQLAEGAGRRLVKAAVLPAAVIGAGLACYNFARFGNPLEFGFNHGVNVFFDTKDQLVSASWIWPNFRWYYLTPPTLLPYFPFVFPADATFRPAGYHGPEAIHGQFVVSLLVLWIGAGVLASFRAVGWPASIRRLLVILAGAFITSAAFILLLGIRANRYLVDFQLPLIALGVVAAASIGQVRSRGYFLKIWRTGLLALAMLVSVNNVLAAIQQFDQFRHTRQDSFKFLTKALNPSWAFWQKLGMVKTGTLVLDVSFRAQAKSVGEPLLTLGVPGYSDSVYALQHPGNFLEFHIDHFGYGGPHSRIFSYEPGKTYTVQIDLGGLHPPASDPYFARSPGGVVHAVKTTARVVFDGQVAVDRNIRLYDAAPWQRDIGSNLISHSGYAPRFSGTISNARWLPPAPLPDRASLIARPCLMRLAAVFPEHMPSGNQPLMSFGITGAGVLLLLQPVAPGHWKLAVDEWGYAMPPASPVAITPGEHMFEVFIGPLAATDPSFAGAAPPEVLSSRRNRLIVWLDGRLAGDFKLSHHAEAFSNPSPGANIQGFSTSEAYFYGQLKEMAADAVWRQKVLRDIQAIE